MKRLLIDSLAALLLAVILPCAASSCSGKAKEPEYRDLGGNDKPIPQKKHWDVMLMGDSLTEESNPGYRGYLYELLRENGYDVDFVGVKSATISNAEFSVTPDPDHSGFGGFTIGPDACSGDDWDGTYGHGNIYYHLDAGWNIMSKKCDVIVLMIGINDNWGVKDKSYDINVDGPNRLEGLVSKIYTLAPDVTILLSNLTPVQWTDKFDEGFNAAVPGIVKKFADAGKKCYFANVHDTPDWDRQNDIRKTTNGNNDGLHLTPSGYQKVAKTFYDALIKDILVK